MKSKVIKAVVVGNKLTLTTDKLENDSLRRIKNEYLLEDEDSGEYDLMRPDLEWLVKNNLLHKNAMDIFESGDIDKDKVTITIVTTRSTE